jgi:hypothetical protein
LFRSYWDNVLAKFPDTDFYAELAYIVGRLGDVGESSGGRHIDEREVKKLMEEERVVLWRDEAKEREDELR